MQVSTIGVISFRFSFANANILPLPISTNDVLIAPFWGNTNTSHGGEVFFMLSTDRDLLSTVGFIISDANFNPELVFIATWNRVPPFDRPSDVCVCAFYVKIPVFHT